jgi:hypothetical protein
LACSHPVGADPGRGLIELASRELDLDLALVSA